MEITFSSNSASFKENLSDIAQRQLPYAMSVALNETAKEGLESNKKLMQKVFDRPTRWTLNAFRIDYARKNRLQATIERKWMVGRRFYLEVQQRGGPRRQTGIERLMTSRLAYSGNLVSVLPTKNTPKNRYGNMSTAFMNRMLSAVQAQGDNSANTTKASRGRNRGRVGYFVPREGSKLSAGVYQRRGKKIKKVLAFSDTVPRYTPKFKFDRNLHRVEERSFKRNFAAAMRRAIKTAR